MSNAFSGPEPPRRLARFLLALRTKARCNGPAWWPERLAPVLALAGVVIASLAGYHVHEWQDSGSDFKNVYASGKCFLHGIPAYNFTNMAKVFHANGVVTPWSWYAHSPIYPPFTYVVLAPLIALPMAVAVYVWMAVSVLAVLIAMWSMSEFCARVFALGRSWRLALVALVAASPLVNFALQVGNISVFAAPVCIAVVMCIGLVSSTWLAVALAVAMLLKPPLAAMVCVGLLFCGAEDRNVALRAFALFAAALVCFGTYYTFRGSLPMQLHDLSAMLRSETLVGSLNPRNHEMLPAIAQITSLEYFFGYLVHGPALPWLTRALLLVMGAGLFYGSIRLRRSGPAARLEILAAWSIFGLLVTYHRSHDAIVLFMILPWLLARWRRRPADVFAWAVFACNVAIGLSGNPPLHDWDWMAHRGLPGLAQFLVFRQSGLATLILMLVFLAHMLAQVRAGVREPA